MLYRILSIIASIVAFIAVYHHKPVEIVLQLCIMSIVANIAAEQQGK